MGGDKDGDVGSLACQGYRNNFGGGKNTPPTVSLMQHAGALTCTEREAHCHCPVRQGGGKEALMVGGGGAAGDFGEGLPGLQGTVGNRHIFQISGTGADGGGRKLAVSDSQIEEG